MLQPYPMRGKVGENVTEGAPPSPASGTCVQSVGATASGVGVQLLNSAGTAPFALSTTSFQAFAGYNKSTGGDYVIPLMARYYRTGNLSPGTATSSMVFTMQYL